MTSSSAQLKSDHRELRNSSVAVGVESSCFIFSWGFAVAELVNIINKISGSIVQNLSIVQGGKHWWKCLE